MKFRNAYKSCISLNDEQSIFDVYRTVPKSRIIYNGRFFKCLRVDLLLRSILFKKNWVDSSKESSPDFHNDKHHIMVEFMRIDDSVDQKNNSFKRKTKTLEKYFGGNYKNLMNGSTLFYVPKVGDVGKVSYKSYLKNFKETIENHSNKVEKYHENFPKCDTCVFFVCDESNCYFTRNTRLFSNNIKFTSALHNCFYDKSFLEIIKTCKADYLIWYTHFKVANSNKKIIKKPVACVYEVNHLKKRELAFPQESMKFVADE